MFKKVFVTIIILTCVFGVIQSNSFGMVSSFKQNSISSKEDIRENKSEDDGNKESKKINGNEDTQKIQRKQIRSDKETMRQKLQDQKRSKLLDITNKQQSKGKNLYDKLTNINDKLEKANQKNEVFENSEVQLSWVLSWYTNFVITVQSNDFDPTYKEDLKSINQELITIIKNINQEIKQIKKNFKK